MSVIFNTMIKNEEEILLQVLPIWKLYPVDKFIFYDDNSEDNSINVIRDLLPENRYFIIREVRNEFSESHNRNKMLELSKSLNAEYVFSIDADELLSHSIVTNFEYFLKTYEKKNQQLYWYNIVNNDLKYFRNDFMYRNNYRTFVLPLNKTNNFDLSQWKYHSPRTPTVNLPTSYTKEFGVIHLQSYDKEFYAIKQLWYKHYEFVNYKHTVDFINGRYDPVVNNLIFHEQMTPPEIIGDIKFDGSFFKKSMKMKRYLSFIHENYKQELITFGKEYV